MHYFHLRNPRLLLTVRVSETSIKLELPPLQKERTLNLPSGKGEANPGSSMQKQPINPYELRIIGAFYFYP